jgi:hypothetical protein
MDRDSINSGRVPVGSSGPSRPTASSGPSRPTASPSDQVTPSKPPIGAIVGGVIGGLVCISAVVLALYLLRKRRQQKMKRISKDAVPFGLVVYNALEPAPKKSIVQLDAPAGGHTNHLALNPGEKTNAVSITDGPASSSTSAMQSGSASLVAGQDATADGPPPYELVSPRMWVFS